MNGGGWKQGVGNSKMKEGTIFGQKAANNDSV